MNTQKRWEAQIEARITAKEVPPLQVTWDYNYANTGVMRVWHGDTQTLVFQVHYDWQGADLRLTPPGRSEGPTIEKAKSWGPTDLGAAQDFLFTQVVDSAMYLLDTVQ